MNDYNKDDLYGGRKQVMTTSQPQPNKHSLRIVVLIAVLVVAILAGGYFGYTIYRRDIASLRSQIGTLQVQLDAIKEQTKNQTQVIFANVSLSELYEKVKDSVVMVYGYIVESSFFGQQVTTVQGSGFVYNFTGQMVVITNFHVVDGVSSLRVTFRNGNGYEATVLGWDVYVDLAVVGVAAPAEELKPLPIVESSTLKVGEPVIAIGNPFGLTGSMTTGIVSQLGRTIRESATGGYSIANIIQFDAPINPGNSGGPLLNRWGKVVGITTAIVESSQGLGFAIPSNTILREVAYLINTGTYTQHSWLGVNGTDMNYDIAKEMHINKTFGWLIMNVMSGSPAAIAGLRGGTQQVQIGGSMVTIGGDVIIAIDGATIINGDALSAYLEENTSPDQTITITVLRDSGQTDIP